MVLLGIGDLKLFGQCAGAPSARRDQLGVRGHDAGGDHGHDQIGLAARPGRQQGAHGQLVHGQEHRVGFAVNF